MEEARSDLGNSSL